VLANRLRNHFRQRNTRPAAAALNDLEDAGNNLSRAWDQEHDAHVAQQLMARVQSDFTPAT
jgi:hypothetical protein